MKSKKKPFNGAAVKLLIFLKSHAKFRVYHVLIFVLLIVEHIGMLIGFTLGSFDNLPLPYLHANVQIIR
jgi:hypothetical protein